MNKRNEINKMINVNQASQYLSELLSNKRESVAMNQKQLQMALTKNDKLNSEYFKYFIV